jgi:hypothetical protein
MPSDLATVLTEQELVDLVAWLTTLKPRSVASLPAVGATHDVKWRGRRG